MQKRLALQQEPNVRQGLWVQLNPWIALCAMAAQTVLGLGCPATEKKADYDNNGYAISGYRIKVLELNAPTAKLEVEPVVINTRPRPELHSVKADGKLDLGLLPLTVLSVVPSNPQTGLRGFVEIGF